MVAHIAVLVALAHIAGASVTPIGTVTGDLVSYILGYGVLGIVSIAFAFRLIIPHTALAEARAERDAAITAARADLIAENQRLIAEKEKVEAQRDEAVKLAQDKLVPLLVNFVSVTTVLIPLLQQAVADQEHTTRRRTGG